MKPIVGDELGAVVVCGGRAVRLGGDGKASIELGGATLLEHALAAVADVPDVMVVGDAVATSRPVTFLREDPVGGGPAAALLAGLRAFPRPPRRVVALAVDMPLVTRATIRRLTLSLDGADGADGAVLVEADGRRQYLCGVYAVSAIERNRPPRQDEYGLPMRRLLDGLRLAEVPAIGQEARDVDTWDDLRELRDLMDRE